jgi:hypothetical protein
MRNWLAALLFATSLAAASDARPVDPLARTVTLNAWNRDVESVLQSIYNQTDVNIQVHRDFIAPADLPRRILRLRADNLTLREALEWISRALGCRYRVDGPRKVVLAGGYEWAERENRTNFIYLGGLKRPGQDDPPPLTDRLMRGIEETHHPSGRPGGTPDTRMAEAERELQRLLRHPVVTAYEGQEAESVLWDLSRQSEVAIAVDPARPDPLPPVTLNVSTLGDALTALGEALETPAVLFTPPRTFWLETGPPGIRVSLESRESLWSELQVVGYPAGRLAAAAGGGDNRLRRRRGSRREAAGGRSRIAPDRPDL